MPKKFLIADDSDAKAMLLEGIIHAAKFSATILRARTTEEAMCIIEKQPDIAFAFVDYEIPTKEGPAVIRFLKEKNPLAHIALVSAVENDAYKNSALAAGAETYVCTSFDMQTVEDTLHNILQSWSTAKA
ncbi:MAG: response regulator [Candidatus Peribacteraceae bacterium]|jgi:DNA-binding NarL/FixJ family response regulator